MGRRTSILSQRSCPRARRVRRRVRAALEVLREDPTRGKPLQMSLKGLRSWYDESVAGTPALTQYLGYDAFGRPATIRSPDGSTHDVTMSYTGDRVVQRTAKIATYSGYDALGHAGRKIDGGSDLSFTFTKGLLTAIPGYSSTIEYHPNGLLFESNFLRLRQVIQWARRQPSC